MERFETKFIVAKVELEVEVRNAVNSDGDDFTPTQAKVDEILSEKVDDILAELGNSTYGLDVEVEDDEGSTFEVVFSVVAGWESDS